MICYICSKNNLIIFILSYVVVLLNNLCIFVREINNAFKQTQVTWVFETISQKVTL